MLAHKKNGTWGMCVNFKVFKSVKQKIFTTSVSILLDHRQPFKTYVSGNTKGKVIHTDHQQL